MKTERVTKKGGRYYRRHEEKSPVVLLPNLTIKLMEEIYHSDKDSPSVTTILKALNKPALVGWAAREERKMIAALAGEIYEQLKDIGEVDRKKFVELVNEGAGKGAHRKFLEKAADVGSKVHARIDWEFKGEMGKEREADPPPLDSEQAQRAFNRWKEWRDSVKLRLVDTERYLFSSMFGWGGTLDGLVYINDILCVIDFKTGKAVYAESYLQNIAYRIALAEEGIDVKGGWIIRLPKYESDPEFDAVQVPDDSTLGPVFLALKVVHKWWAKAESDAKKKRPAKGATPDVVVAADDAEVV